MFDILLCTSHQHNFWLVGVALLVSVFAAATSARLMMNASRARRKSRLSLFILSGVCGGAGVWATHFIGMLAFDPGMGTGYDPVGTVGSLVISLVGGAIAVLLTIKTPKRWADLTWGVTFGLSAAAMHYTGMAALRLQGHLSWRPSLVIASILTGVGLSMAARVMARRMKSKAGFALSTGLIVAATCSVHFLGMAAVVITPDVRAALPVSSISHGILALGIVILTALVGLACFGSLWIEALAKASSVHLLRNIIEVLPQGLAYFDADERFVLGNEAYRRELSVGGIEPKPGETFSDALQFAALSGRLAVAAGQEQAFIDATLQARIVGSNNREQITLDGRVLRVENKRTHDQGMVTVVSDISDLKQQAKTLAAARDVAEAADRAKSAFLANMSHELRTPMNGVIAVAELLANEPLTASQAELVELIRSSGSTLDRVLCDILDVSRIEAGALEIRMAPFELVEAVETVLLQFAADATKKGLALELCGAPAKPCYVMGDAIRIKQVLGNLISNAIKFTNAGHVDVSLSVLGEKAVFSVTDTGIGFDVSQSDRLFDRFEQADNSNTRSFDGAGLGLSIARDLVDGMGGSLTCDSRLGVGSVFTLVLPLRPSFAPQVLAPPHVDAVELSETPARVLVVDDNPINQRVLSLMLEGAGIDAALANDGQEAVDSWASGGFDAILMDIQMPVMDGLSAVRTIRAREAEQGLPATLIVMVSANAMPEHVAASVRAGANGHVAKPVTAERLFAALEQRDDPTSEGCASTVPAA